MKIKLEPAASRAEAIKLGRVHYYGAPCKRCGGTKRYKQSWGCVACAIAASTARQHGLREAKWLPNGEPVPAGWVEREPLGHHAHYGRLICRQVPA
ncbi:MAG TPA: hypothetical protein VGV37_06225 [Aliidongia sp.]|uniref:hypothetical protein n=1 Tax=Aliidongia sp. TaxID=1914230 RepID=UPI002DDD915D|nr:hypothetical protein [Aliidongia sp.]HEV2674121.1 hypothetical protein [Aliidongia sp.]